MVVGFFTTLASGVLEPRPYEYLWRGCDGEQEFDIIIIHDNGCGGEGNGGGWGDLCIILCLI